MIAYPDWLPELIEFTGDWNTYVEDIYKRFVDDVVHHKVTYKGLVVKTRYHPPSDGKGFGFWHCVSEAGLKAKEENRLPDLERCKRIGWIRAIIEHPDDRWVKNWSNRRNGEICHLLWFNEEYLIVLAQRQNYLLLKTAYRTNREHTKRRLSAEHDNPINS